MRLLQLRAILVRHPAAIRAHRRAAVPAAVILDVIPADWKDLLAIAAWATPGQFPACCYVKILAGMLVAGFS